MILSGLTVNYIDTGTAGVVFTSLWAVIVGVLSMVGAFLVTYFIRPIRMFLAKIARLFSKPPKNRKVIFIFLAVIITSGLAALTMLMDGTIMLGGNKVLLIGIDALDARVVEKLMTSRK